MSKRTSELLSANDEQVLESIFNPLQIGGNISNEVFNIQTDEQNLCDPPEENSFNIRESINLEIEGIKAAEKGNISQAINLFTNAINYAIQRASPYNNRAQAFRLQGDESAALADLHKALELSGFSGKTGCQALCQRGIIYRKLEKTEDARKDFERAAKLGSKFARTQLIEMNPYAALCNQMLRDAFEKLD